MAMVHVTSRIFVSLIVLLSLTFSSCNRQSDDTSRHTAYVAFAGSLAVVNDQEVGPAFSHATGYGYQSHAGGSFGVANLILSQEISPNVFESVGLAPIAKLDPRFTTWAIGFATQPLVVAYSPQGPFSAKLKAIADGKLPFSTLFTIMAQPGFHLGRTNPETDPQGQAFIIMLKLAVQRYHLSPTLMTSILGHDDNPEQIFAETALVSRLQAGQLDAASAFLPQALQNHLHYLTLPDEINLGNPTMADIYATQGVTLKQGRQVGTPLVLYVCPVKGTPSPEAGLSFIRYLLSPAGKALYQKNGYQLIKPRIVGGTQSLPADIYAELLQ